jgi:hypothetical protein
MMASIYGVKKSRSHEVAYLRIWWLVVHKPVRNTSFPHGRAVDQSRCSWGYATRRPCSLPPLVRFDTGIRSSFRFGACGILRSIMPNCTRIGPWDVMETERKHHSTFQEWVHSDMEPPHDVASQNKMKMTSILAG